MKAGFLEPPGPSSKARGLQSSRVMGFGHLCEEPSSEPVGTASYMPVLPTSPTPILYSWFQSTCVLGRH